MDRNARSCRGKAPTVSTVLSRCRLPVLAWLVLVAGGCAALRSSPPPPPELPPDPLETPAPIVVAPPEPRCEPCAELHEEIAQLRRELAAAQGHAAKLEGRLSDAREKSAAQANALQASQRQADLARARLRRLATPATAASYLAEVEVVLVAARSSTGDGREQALLARAQQAFDSSREPFVRGDYAEAIERAAQAEDLVAEAARAAERASAMTGKVVNFVEARPLRARVDSHLRAGPSSKASVVGVVRRGAPVRAHAARGRWYRLETADGRWGWTYQPLLEPR